MFFFHSSDWKITGRDAFQKPLGSWWSVPIGRVNADLSI
jgi:hypothetical protein